MTSARLNWAALAGACAAFAAGHAFAQGAVQGSVQGSGAADLYYERSLMMAADARCGLFEPELAAALGSAQAQARGAALRAGTSDDALAQIRARAVGRAGAARCDSRDLKTAAGRVRAAFEGYSRLQRMTFAGQFSPWKADRAASIQEATWRLSQSVAFGPDRAVFGLAGTGRMKPAVSVSAYFANGSWPYAARLVMRDVARAPRAQLGRAILGAQDTDAPLEDRMPPRAAGRVVLAESRSLADPLLAPAGARSSVLFRFPAQAADLIDGLDPREAIAVEFLFAGRERDEVRTAYIEVGDFAAGRAFLKVQPR